MGRTWTMPRRGKYALALGVAALTATAAIAGTGSAGAAGSNRPPSPRRARTSRRSPLAADRDPEVAPRTAPPTRCADRSEPARAAGGRTCRGGREAQVRIGRVLPRQPEGPAGDQSARHRPQINRRSAAVRAYSRYIARRETSFRSALAARVPNAKVGRALRLVYGGIALRVPANKVADVLRLPGVGPSSATSCSSRRTDAAPRSSARTTVANELGGVDGTAGQGVIFGDLDTGVWPEHPSFADHGNLARRRRPTATPRPCDFGDNPLTPAADPFVCNNKLIGGAAVPRHLPRRSSATRSSPAPRATPTATAPTRHAPPPATWSRTRQIFGVERGPISGHRPGRARHRRTRSAARRAASPPTRRPPSSRRSSTASTSSTSRSAAAIRRSPTRSSSPSSTPTTPGVFVVGLGRQRRPGRRHHRHLSPWVIDRRRVDPAARVPVDADPDAGDGADAVAASARRSRTASRTASPVVIAGDVRRLHRHQRSARLRPRRARSPARSSSASAACNGRGREGLQRQARAAPPA